MVFLSHIFCVHLYLFNQNCIAGCGGYIGVLSKECCIIYLCIWICHYLWLLCYEKCLRIEILALRKHVRGPWGLLPAFASSRICINYILTKSDQGCPSHLTFANLDLFVCFLCLLSQDYNLPEQAMLLLCIYHRTLPGVLHRVALVNICQMTAFLFTTIPLWLKGQRRYWNNHFQWSNWERGLYTCPWSSTEMSRKVWNHR